MPVTSLMISHREMKTARDAGRATPLTSAIPEFVRYWGDWWVSCADGWLRITDTHLAGRLDLVRQRLDIEQEEQACLRAQAQAADWKEEPPWLLARRGRQPHVRPGIARTLRRARLRPNLAVSPRSSSPHTLSRAGTCCATASSSSTTPATCSP